MWVYAKEIAAGEKGGQVKMWKCSNKVYEQKPVTQADTTAAPTPTQAAQGPDLSKIQTIGGARCHFLSDGTLRLKSDTKRVLAKGTPVTEPVMLSDLPSGYTCQKWREEQQAKLTFNPTKVVQM
jgi:hypothetical protein